MNITHSVGFFVWLHQFSTIVHIHAVHRADIHGSSLVALPLLCGSLGCCLGLQGCSVTRHALVLAQAVLLPLGHALLLALCGALAVHLTLVATRHSC